MLVWGRGGFFKFTLVGFGSLEGQGIRSLLPLAYDDQHGAALLSQFTQARLDECAGHRLLKDTFTGCPALKAGILDP